MRYSRRLLVVGLAIAIMAGPIGGVRGQAQDSAGEEYAHPEWFAEVDWLQEQLGGDDLAIIALTPAEEFVAGHIPGAAQIDWPALEVVETSDASLAAWQTDVEAMLTELGIERSDTVVVYDGGTFIAARLWWILHLLGHEDVRVLNGGLEAWVAEDGELATGESTARPAAEAYAGDPSDAALVSITEAEAALDQADTIFIDARRPDDEFAVAHIPGAINVPFMANAEAEVPSTGNPPPRCAPCTKWQGSPRISPSSRTAPPGSARR